jgi:hypothetical protein
MLFGKYVTQDHVKEKGNSVQADCRRKFPQELFVSLTEML